MTPAEFYVSSDALVHLQVSTKYLSKSCRTVELAGCLSQQAKVSSRGQSTTKYNRQQHQREGLKCIMNI